MEGAKLRPRPGRYLYHVSRYISDRRHTLELDTGEVAVVKAVNRSDLLRPKVLVYMDSEGQRYSKPFEVDFSAPERKAYRLISGQSVLPPDLEKFIEL